MMPLTNHCLYINCLARCLHDANMMLSPYGPKARIKLFHHGEIMVGINERLGDPEMNTVLTLTQNQHDENERRDKDKEQQKDASTKKGKKAGEDKKSK